MPAARVIDWLDGNFAKCAISSITVFELAVGVQLLDPGRRRETLNVAIARMTRRFEARIYAFDAAAAGMAAELLARSRAQGLGLHQIPAKLADLQIAGIASAYGLSLATRNTGDFRGLGLTIVDPWTA